MKNKAFKNYAIWTIFSMFCLFAVIGTGCKDDTPEPNQVTNPGNDSGNDSATVGEVQIPSITTDSAISILDVSAKISATISYQGEGDLPTITAAGICWSTNDNPTVSDDTTMVDVSKGNFSNLMTELTAVTKYNVRAYASTKDTTVYGDVFSFTTFALADYDGNVYDQVKIGDQIWLKENFKCTHYRNGDEIEDLFGKLEGTDPLDPSYVATYGQLYSGNDFVRYDVNGNAVGNSQKHLAPEGWHVPTWDEWNTLTGANGDNAFVSKVSYKFKAKNIWEDANGAATTPTNETGFSAVPAGYMASPALDKGKQTIMWSSTVSPYVKDPDGGDVLYRTSMSFNTDDIATAFTQPLDFHASVRLIKDK